MTEDISTLKARINQLEAEVERLRSLLQRQAASIVDEPSDFSRMNADEFLAALRDERLERPRVARQRPKLPWMKGRRTRG
jgi:F0F1-type ATP synthase membrane subunit b/b'